MSRTKGQWRAELLGVRRKLSAEEVSYAGDLLLDRAQEVLRDARCVAAYISVSPEPETGPVLDWLRDRGVRVLLPVLRDDNDLGWGEASSGLGFGRFGLRQPSVDLGVDEIRAAELVLAPAVAVDRFGTRLGRGGGSYDRALARVTAPIVAAVYDTELVDALPVDEHDRPVDFALTPQRLVSVGRGT